MPNYVTVSIATHTEEDFDFRNDFTSFEDIIPMPKELQGTVSGTVSLYVQRNVEKGLKWLVQHRDAYTRVLDIALSYRALQAIGYKDWYDWRNQNWGTKWDMEVFSIEKNYIEFQVPWSLPEPLLRALFEKFPKVEFSGKFAEDQIGYLSGEFESVDGELIIYYDDSFSNEAYERYFSLCGGEEDYELIDGKYVYVEDD